MLPFKRSPLASFRRLLCLLLVIPACLSLLPPAFAEVSTSVALTVANDLAIDRDGDDVTSGIPIPKSWNAFSTDTFTIATAAGKSVPAQFVVTARWGGAPDDASKPIKWVLATFQVAIPAASIEKFTLSMGGSPAAATALKIISDTATAMIIDTGAAQFTLNKSKFSLFDSVTVGGIPITQPGENGIMVTDANGKEYTSRNDTPTTVRVEESGPVRLVVEVDGTLRDAGGSAMLDYIAHLYFYAGQSYVRIVQTVGNHRQAAVNPGGSGYDVFNYNGQNSVTFRELSDGIVLYKPNGELSYLLPSEAGTKSGDVSDLTVYQDSSGNAHWNRYAQPDKAPRLGSYVKFSGYTATDGSSQVDAGRHFAGWMDISDASKGVTVGLHRFWQNFPKALSASKGGDIQINLFPKEFASTYNFRVGEEKTNELFLFFHAGTAKTALALQMATRLNAPLMAMAPSDWYRMTGAVEPYVASTKTLEARKGECNVSDDAERWEYYNDRTLVADERYTGDYYSSSHSLWLSTAAHESSTDYYDFYGWSWYGNQPLEQESTGDGQAGAFNLKYNLDYGAWIHFLRSGDARWRDMADAFSKHLESLMLHEVVTDTGWDIARWKNAIFGHSNHYESGNTNSVRNYAGPVADTAFGAQGAALHYYLTGYPPSKRFVAQAAAYAQAWYMDPANEYDYAHRPEWAPSREAANVVTLLTEGFRMTGNRDYQKSIQKVIDDYTTSKQAWINGPIEGSTVSLATWIFGLYYNSVARYIELADEYGLASESAIAKTQLAAYLKWHWNDVTYSPSGWTTTYEYYKVNGDNDPNSVKMINNWTLLLADSFAYGYAFTGDTTFLDAAKKYYHTGTQNPAFVGSPLIYSSSKEAVNHAAFGHVAMYYAQAPIPTPDPTPTPTPNHAPAAKITILKKSITTNYRAHTSIAFSGAGSTDADGDVIVSYQWDFGDGSKSEGAEAVVSHTYAKAGIYSVSLTVSDGKATGTVSLALNVMGVGSRPRYAQAANKERSAAARSKEMRRHITEVVSHTVNRQEQIEEVPGNGKIGDGIRDLAVLDPVPQRTVGEISGDR